MVNVLLQEHHYAVDRRFNQNACSSLTVSGGNSPSPVASKFSGKSAAEMEEDGFYQKLNKLNESSGLSLLFNFHHKSMDLHQFYKIVTDEGGYHQVTKCGKWEDIAATLDPENRVPLSPTQVQKLYATILYPFEQKYHYRSPVKPRKGSKTFNVPLEPWEFESGKVMECQCCSVYSGDNYLNDLTGKRKHEDRNYASESHFHDGESLYNKIEYDHGSRMSSPGMVEERKLVFETSGKHKKTRKELPVPLGSRNCFQVFSKIECDRLKTIYGDSQYKEIRETVIEAWRSLSSYDKQPYIEASKKDKQRYAREMVAYEEHKRKKRTQPQTTQKLVKFSSPAFTYVTKTPSQEEADGTKAIPHKHSGNQKVVDFLKPCSMQANCDYQVTLEPDEGHEIAPSVNESTVQMVLSLMKTARPNDPVFEIDWDV